MKPLNSNWKLLLIVVLSFRRSLSLARAQTHVSPVSIRATAAAYKQTRDKIQKRERDAA